MSPQSAAASAPAPSGARLARVTICPLPQSYTTCALGIQFVGYVMICFGAVDALCSVLFGRLARHTGRTALFALGRQMLGAAWGGSGCTVGGCSLCEEGRGWGEEGGLWRHTNWGRRRSGGRQGASQEEEILVQALDEAGCLNTHPLLLPLGDQAAAETR